ncbi:hypothetical protein [Methanolobus sp. WCC5]|uniref:hypothetical protein n=1 Tax=Methanolobus sp. WCC5 TaxID=3125785 RepID=UPI003250C0C9
MDSELTELKGSDLEHYAPAISKKEIIDIFLAYDIRLIRYFGSDLFYVEMIDGEPLVPVHPGSSYPPGIERIFDLMARERINMLSYGNEKMMKSCFPVDSTTL